MCAKTGCSLPYGLFSGKGSKCSAEFLKAFGSIEKILEYSSLRFDSIELRTVRTGNDPQVLCDAVRLIESYGLEVSIHGELCEKDLFFHTYKELIYAEKRKNYNITVHPLADMESTVKILREICGRIEAESLPLFITLENQRITPKKSFGSCEDILDAVGEVDSSYLGICFDFGHQFSNEKNGICDEICDGFISRVRHTHVHSLYEGTTHFPLDVGKTPLDRDLMRLISHGYDGLLCLELSPERYNGELDVVGSLSNSARIIEVASKQIAIKKRSLDFYNGGFLDALKSVKDRFDRAENCVALVGHSGYVIKFGNARIAVDIAPRVISLGEEARKFISEWVGSVDAYVLSHAHVDHYDPEFVAGLPECVHFLVPDFMDVNAKQVTRVRAGDMFELGEVKLSFFESGHSLGESKVDEYGFYIEYQGKKYVFPVDVRNYEFDLPQLENVRALFAHLWLGKKMALKTYEGEYAEKFCRFVEKFGAEECYVSHLNDIHRNIDSMWTEIHFDMIKGKLPEARIFEAPDIAIF